VTHLSLSRGRLESLLPRRRHLDFRVLLKTLYETGYGGFVSGEFCRCRMRPRRSEAIEHMRAVLSSPSQGKRLEIGVVDKCG